MATKYLDLDALVTDDITVRMNGTDHKYKQMSVEDFIWAQKKVDSLEKEQTENEQVDMMIQIIQRSFPTIGQTDLLKLSMDKLMALVDFVLSLSKPATEINEGDSGNVPSPTVPSQS